jgi:S1-C subfamily serine protease
LTRHARPSRAPPTARPPLQPRVFGPGCRGTGRQSAALTGATGLAARLHSDVTPGIRSAAGRGFRPVGSLSNLYLGTAATGVAGNRGCQAASRPRRSRLITVVWWCQAPA